LIFLSVFDYTIQCRCPSLCLCVHEHEHEHGHGQRQAQGQRQTRKQEQDMYTCICTIYMNEEPKCYLYQKSCLLDLTRHSIETFIRWLNLLFKIQHCDKIKEHNFEKFQPYANINRRNIEKFNATIKLKDKKINAVIKSTM
jgi:hypothetical protein